MIKEYRFIDKEGIIVKTYAKSELAAKRKINKIRRKLNKKISKLEMV